jgi:multiple sugar transport system substrate-binding protein
MSHRLSSHVTRRQFLVTAGLSAGSVLLAACGGATSTPTTGTSTTSTVASAANPPQGATTTAAGQAATTAQGATTTSTAASSAATPQATAMIRKGTEVIWSCYDLGGTRNQVLQDMAKSVSDESGLKVTLRTEPSDQYWDNLQLKVAGGGAPDICVNQVNWVQGGAARGVFLPLDDYMRADNIKREDFLDFGSWLYQGKLYGMSNSASGDMVFLNKKLFTAAGLPLPAADWNWQTLLDLATKLTNGQGAGKQFGLQWGALGLYETLGSWVLNNGGHVLNDARDRALFGDDPKSIEAAQWVTDTIAKAKLAPVPASLKGQPDPFNTGRVAINVTGSYRLDNARDGIGAENLSFLPIPKGPTGRQSPSVGSNAWSILGSTKVRDEAWAAIRLLTDTKRQTIFMKSQSPSLVSLFYSPEYLKSSFPGEEDLAKLVFDTWSKDAHDYFITPDCSEWWAACDNYLAPMYSGEQTVPQAMQAAAKAVNDVFAKRTKQ